MPHIAPVLGIGPEPVYVRTGSGLAQNGIADAPAAHAERGVLHAKHIENLPLVKVAQALLGDALDDLAGEQRPHTLVAEIRARFIEQRRGECCFHELA